jgi:hypothetical protein
LQASPHFATSFRVTFSPLPPIQSGTCGLLTPLGSLMGLSMW